MCFLSKLAFRVSKRDDHSSRPLSCPYLRVIEFLNIPPRRLYTPQRAHARGNSSTALRGFPVRHLFRAPPGTLSSEKGSTPPSGNPARLSGTIIFRATIPRSRGYAHGVTRPRPAASRSRGPSPADGDEDDGAPGAAHPRRRVPPPSTAPLLVTSLLPLIPPAGIADN